MRACRTISSSTTIAELFLTNLLPGNARSGSNVTLSESLVFFDFNGFVGKVPHEKFSLIFWSAIIGIKHAKRMRHIESVFAQTRTGGNAEKVAHRNSKD